MFKEGDQVRCINDQVVGNSYPLNLTEGNIYTVKGTKTLEGTRRVAVKGVSADALYASRFEPYKISNEERIARRMEELNEQV